MPVELKSPGGLWLLGLLVPLVLLYILKVRRQRLRVASTWLWAQAQRDLMAKSPFKRLIMQVPLVLQALALILLALALARPATRGGAIIGDHVAIIVDTSASMGAKTADGTTRMEAARAAAKNVIAALGPGADAMLVEAGSDANIASPWIATLDASKRPWTASESRTWRGIWAGPSPSRRIASASSRATSASSSLLMAPWRIPRRSSASRSPWT